MEREKKLSGTRDTGTQICEHTTVNTHIKSCTSSHHSHTCSSYSHSLSSCWFFFLLLSFLVGNSLTPFHHVFFHLHIKLIRFWIWVKFWCVRFFRPYALREFLSFTKREKNDEKTNNCIEPSISRVFFLSRKIFVRHRFKRFEVEISGEKRCKLYP